MRASILISELQKAVEEFGDLEILIRHCEDGYNLDLVAVCPDPPSPMEVKEGIEGTIDLCAVDKRGCGSLWYCVVSSYYDNGDVTAAIVKVSEAENMPQNSKEELSGKTVYTEWYGSKKEAQDAVQNARKA